MLYIFLDTNQIKVLYLKKSLLGQFDAAFYEKQYQMNFLDKGEVVNPDMVASAIKESLSNITQTTIKEKEVDLILPQSAFHFTRTDVPMDIAPSALMPFVKDKARANLMVDLDLCSYDFIVHEIEGVQQAVLYAMESELIQKYAEPLKLLDLEIKSITPESLAYYTLFEKTLRKDKKENIFFVSFQKKQLVGYVYDSFGLVDNERWVHSLTSDETVEDVLKIQTERYEKKGMKLNRLILSGEKSDDVRQDTFTKKVGVWTNPLKRIIPHFYDEYVKLFNSESDKIMPFLQFDANTGATVFAMEYTDFSLFKKGSVVAKSVKKQRQSHSHRADIAKRHGKFPVKAILIFGGSFLVTIGILFAVTRVDFSNININLAIAEPTATPTPVPPTPVPPTPTPTIVVEREDVRIMVLNGTGRAGFAGRVRDIFRQAGYGDVLTGNADEFGYETTVIQVKDGQEGLANMIAEDIEDNVSQPKMEALEDDNAADVVVIIGSDFR